MIIKFLEVECNTQLIIMKIKQVLKVGEGMIP